MALTKVTNGGITDSAITSAKIDNGSIINADIKSDAAITASKLSATLDLSSKTITLPAASVTAHATTPTLDSPSITGTLSVDSGGNVSHTVANWSDDITYTITPTNCTVGSITTSGVFVVTHTSGVPSYTIKATTDSLGLDDSALVTKNIVVNLTAPTLSSPANTTITTNVVYTVTSADSNDDKIILDMGTSNFTYQSVDVGSGSKVGNTVEVTGFTTNNPAITIQFTALGTYSSVKAKSTNIAGTYGDSNYSATDSIICYTQLSAPTLDSPADTNDSTAVTYTVSSIDSDASKVIFDVQSSNFTLNSVSSGTGVKSGNTVEVTSYSGSSLTINLTYTTPATYNNKAKVSKPAAWETYTDSNYSSTDSIVIASAGLAAEYLIVAGGGAGGYSGGGGTGAGGGGGGAGGFRLLSSTLATGGHTVTIGAGGNTGNSGTNSSISGISATGGGSGGSKGSKSGNHGASGGSGGGGKGNTTLDNHGTGNSGSYSPVEGYDGAPGRPYSGGGGWEVAGGGGGGAGAAATYVDGASGSYAASAYAIATSSGVSGGWFAGGGGAGSGDNGGAGSGIHGGGNGNGGSASTNSGSGGGGYDSWPGGSGGNGYGGSGIVIVRYSGSTAATGGTIVTTGGYTYHKFTSSGTFTVS